MSLLKEGAPVAVVAAMTVAPVPTAGVVAESHLNNFFFSMLLIQHFWDWVDNRVAPPLR